MVHNPLAARAGTTDGPRALSTYRLGYHHGRTRPHDLLAAAGTRSGTARYGTAPEL